MIKLSPYHEIFYNEWKLNPQRSDYNIVIDNEMRGELDPVRFNQALLRLTHDYFLLHSNVKEVNGTCYWVEKAKERIRFEYFTHPLSNNALLTYVRTPFDLSSDSLLRVALIKLADQHFRIVMVIHHIIMDGSKENFMFETIPQYYNDETYHYQLTIDEQCDQLDKFNEKFSTWLRNNGNIHQQFWCNQLVNVPGVDLRFLKKSEESKTPDGNSVGEYLFSFNAHVLKNLRHVAKKYATTPYLLSLAIFAGLLFRHTQQPHMGICVPVAIPEGAEFIYGSNVSPGVFTFQIQHSTPLFELIGAIKKYFKEIKSHNHYYFPLQKIPSTLINKDLLDVAFTQTNLKNRCLQLQGTHDEKVNTSLNIDLAGKLLVAQEVKDNQVYYRVMYQKNYVDSDLLYSFINTYQRLLTEILNDLIQGNENASISKYSLLDHAQRNKIALEWNETDHPYPHKTLHQLFEEQVKKTPEAIALVNENVIVTYASLNETANRLAHFLRRNFHIQADTTVGICVQPGHHMIVALWGVLKSGSAYVPIDPTTPGERIKYILNDTQSKVVITDGQGVHQLSQMSEDYQTCIVNLDSLQMANQLATESPDNLSSISEPHHLAYVIYTSGTMGKPKGVMIEHRNVVNYVTYLIEQNRLTTKSVAAKYASFGFDGSVIEIYPVMLSGGKLCIVEESQRLDCKKVNDFFHRHGVTFAFLPTPFAELFFELKNTNLKNLMVGGERLKKFIPQNYEVTNAYGPTEATVQATMSILDKNTRSISIGKPIRNSKCFVVDEKLNLLPVGAIGELLIGGNRLARQYLHLPDLTAQQFVLNPFQSKQEREANENTYLYRTGDLVRWLPDGNLEYIGRNDEQVKVRGHRIELGEIECALMQYRGIQQAAAIVATDICISSKKQITAYYVADSMVNHDDLKGYLSQHLPKYMLPSALMRMENMPLTTSGKIDKTALPAPAWNSDQPYTAPRNKLEMFVCAVYEQILGLEKDCVGIHHNFFELGGDSISAVRLTFLLEQHFKIDVADIFKLKTPANIIWWLKPEKDTFLEKISQIKQLYQNKINFPLQASTATTSNYDIVMRHQQYLEKINHAPLKNSINNKIRAVLLTGATGFLGSHLLATLLAETPYHIYLPVRATSDAAAFERLNKKMKYYFTTGLENNLDRISIFSASLEQQNLGLEADRYQMIADQIDSIIHCASVVKYYGFAEGFQKENIESTAHLLELAKLTANRDFHYISTVGVALDGHIPDQNYYIFTEDDDLNNLVRGNHPYIQSKYQAEQLVRQHRLHGVDGTIYRVGNLAMHSQTHTIQENYQENMLFAHIKAMVKFKMVPEEIADIQASPVDSTALALVKLFDKTTLSNKTYHVFNPNTFNLKNVLLFRSGLENPKFTLEDFIKAVIATIEFSDKSKIHPYLLMLYQLWLNEIKNNHSTDIKICQKQTEIILAKLGFHWPTLTSEMFSEFVNKSSSE